MRKLLIVDPTLVSLEGHSYNYDRALYGAAQRHFDDVILYTGSGFRSPAGDGLKYRPILNRLPIDRLKRQVNAFFRTLRQDRATENAAPLTPSAVAHATVMPNVWRWLIYFAKLMRSWDLGASMRAVINGAGGKPDDEIHVLLQHAHLPDLLVADKLRGVFTRPGPAVHLHLILRYSPDLVNSEFFSMPEFAALLRRLAKSVTPHVHLFTDSERLAREYEALGVPRVVTLPVPILLPERVKSEATSDSELHVAFLGSSRVEKGFCELPGLIRMLPRKIGRHHIRAMIQIMRESADPRIREVIEALETLGHEIPGSIELLEGPVPISIYYSWVSRSSLVVLPYLSPKYNASTSGIFVEAICFGVPVICPSNSWMSDVIEGAAQAHGQKIGEVFNGLEQIPALIARIAGDLMSYRRSVEAFSRGWRDEHNPDACMRVLLAAAGIVA